MTEIGLVDTDDSDGLYVPAPVGVGDGRAEKDLVRERLVELEARGANGIIFGTSGYDVERELRAYAEVARLR
jgi:hypothetical protein